MDGSASSSNISSQSFPLQEIITYLEQEISRTKYLPAGKPQRLYRGTTPDDKTITIGLSGHKQGEGARIVVFNSEG